ncbi:MAG: hypothetical protein JNM63_08475 [Spirochaetia bacterium]|nr:hypothetical protein [Spirochaetia bacterium]
MKIALIFLTLSAMVPATETNFEARLLAFRHDLADPKKFDFRQGLVIQSLAVQEALSNFRKQNASELDTRLWQSFSNLKPGKIPPLSAYKKILAVDTNRFVEMSEALKGMSTLYPDAQKLSRFLLNVVFPVTAAREVGLSAASVGAWLGFLNTAEPEYLLYSKGAAGILTGLDYGGRDVFVAEWRRRDEAWLPAAFTWWQKITP